MTIIPIDTYQNYQKKIYNEFSDGLSFDNIKVTQLSLAYNQVKQNHEISYLEFKNIVKNILAKIVPSSSIHAIIAYVDSVTEEKFEDIVVFALDTVSALRDFNLIKVLTNSRKTSVKILPNLISNTQMNKPKWVNPLSAKLFPEPYIPKGSTGNKYIIRPDRDTSVSTDVLNIVQNQSMSIDLDQYKKLDEISLMKPKHTTMQMVLESNKAKDEINFIIENGNEFYLKYMYDKRGRLNSRGYHIHLQSNIYKKTLINGQDNLILNAEGHDAITEAIMNCSPDENCLAEKYASHASKFLTPTNVLIGADATASGLQILGAMTQCESTMRLTNIINTTGKVSDVHSAICNHINAHESVSTTYSKKSAKIAIMTHFYGSIAEPLETFGEDLGIFYDVLEEYLAGPTAFNKIISNTPPKEEYHWVMPDGFEVFIKAKVSVVNEIQFEDTKFNYLRKVAGVPRVYSGLGAHIVHSIDAWIVRELHRYAKHNEFALYSIFDSFWCHPNFMEQVKYKYHHLVAHCCTTDLLNDIFQQLNIKIRWENDKVEIPLTSSYSFALI